MNPSLLLDFEFVVSQQGYVVRALLKLSGTPRSASANAKTPLNLSLVLDRSGSMGGDKMHAAREAAAMLVRRLRVEDVVSVVAFDDSIETVALPATGDAQRSLPASIAGIEARGSTNLSGGWLRGRELVAQVKREGAVNRVILLTDGQANAGIVEPQLLTALCTGARTEGITTTTIGFGADYDEGLLRQMADAGGGNTFYIERPDQAAGVFEEELEGLLTLCAQNVAMDIRPTADVSLVRVHHDVPLAEIPGGCRAELGDLYAREPRAILVEFFVPGGDEALQERAIAEVVIHAHVLTDEGGMERREVKLTVASPLARSGHAEPEVRREVLLLSAARAREAALEARNRGDYEGGGAMLREVAASMASYDQDGAMGEEIADLGAMAALFSQGAVAEQDAKYMAQRAYNADRKKEMYGRKLRRGNREAT